MVDDCECFGQDDIECPYCGHGHKKEAEDLPWRDEGEVTFKCNECGKDFLCRAWINVNWTTSGTDE